MRPIDADALNLVLDTAINIARSAMKTFGLEGDPELEMELKAYRGIREGIDELPTIEPQQKTGRWIFEERKRLVDETDDGSVYRTEKWWSCSECGYAKGYQISKPSSNYCENCGAEMRKDGDAE